MGRLQRAGPRDARIRALAQWWTQATDEGRYGLVQRVRLQKAPQKGDPTHQELYLAIYLAEIEAGERQAG